MPSPIGHLITGAAIGRAITPDKPRMVAWCAVLAAAPDLDLLFPGTHRTVTHSVGAVIAVAVVTIVSILVTGKVTGVRPGVRYGVRPRVRSEEDVNHIIYDPQTSGGLLVAIDSKSAPDLEHAFAARGVRAWTIGRVVPLVQGVHIRLA